MSKKYFLIISGIIFLALGLSSCTAIKHLDELLTLKELGDEQSKMDAFVDQKNLNFEKVLQDARSKSLDAYQNQKQFLEEYGQPVLSRNIELEGQNVQQWIYRYETEFFNSDKIYVYFDKNKNLVRWELKEATHGKGQQKN